MKRFWVLVLCLFVSQTAFAFNIVYPKSKNVVINSPTTFFIGSSKKSVKINGVSIPLHRTGAFAYFVKLPSNVNTFKIESDGQIETYTISKKRVVSNSPVSTKLIEYQSIKPVVVDVENTPLRSTPVDAGINRMAHLQKGVLLNADGEKNGFYRVKLNETKKGWISKNNVKQTESFKPARIESQKFTENDENYVLKLHLDKRVPFEITEGANLKLQFFNTEKEQIFQFPYKEKNGNDKLFGYSGKYENNDFIFTVNKPPKIDNKKPLKGIKITVDPGHGGKETGTTGCFGDKEKDVVLKISKYLEKELSNRGAKVFMTRHDDSYVGLYDRVKMSNDNGSMFFVSIHNNALPDTLDPNKHRGTSTYYYYGQSETLAKNVLNTMVEQLGTQNDNIHRQSFAVVRNTNALAILVEVAYMINPDDNEMLLNEEFQKNTAKAISDGIEKTLKE